jgi:hypothetical protein
MLPGKYSTFITWASCLIVNWVILHLAVGTLVRCCLDPYSKRAKGQNFCHLLKVAKILLLGVFGSNGKNFALLLLFLYRSKQHLSSPVRRAFFPLPPCDSSALASAPRAALPPNPPWLAVRTRQAKLEPRRTTASARPRSPAQPRGTRRRLRCTRWGGRSRSLRSRWPNWTAASSSTSAAPPLASPMPPSTASPRSARPPARVRRPLFLPRSRTRVWDWPALLWRGDVICVP